MAEHFSKFMTAVSDFVFLEQNSFPAEKFFDKVQIFHHATV